MANVDSMFLIEISLLSFTNHMFCKDFDIIAKFSDVFKMTLRKPTRQRRKRVRGSKEERKQNINIIDIDIEDLAQTEYLEMKLKTTQAVLLPSHILKLSMQMKTCPLEVTLWRRNPLCPMGSVKIPWNRVFWSYLSQAYSGKRVSPVTVIENVDLYNDTTYKLVASTKLKMKLSYLRYRAKPPLSQVTSDEQKLVDDVKPSEPTIRGILKLPTKSRSMDKTTLEPLAVSPTYKEIQESFQEAMDNVPLDQMFILLPQDKQPYIVEELDEVPTSKQWNNGNAAPQPIEDVTESSKSSYTNVSENDRELNRLTILSLTKSETKFTNDDKKFVDITRSRSISAFNILDRHNPLYYIFLNKDQPFADQLYTVGYMALAKKDKKAATPQERSHENACACKSAKACMCADNIGKIADPCVVECKGLTCERDMLPPPDDRLLLSLSQPCCEVQELHGEMKASIHAGTEPGEKPCECTCSCTFDFIKKTAYCKICGGYETTQGDLDDLTVHPCPIFHKEVLVDKKAETGGKKKKKLAQAAGDDDKDKDRDLDEARFKFNYGYQGIPPHIGHGNCGLSCIGGDDGPVPKDMGWLWTSENVPGLKFRPAWRPGAILKFVLKQLTTTQPLPQRGGKNKHVPEKRKKKKELKKNEKKPMLIVTKKDGEYMITMETAKVYGKPRLLNQYPYEDKPPVTYMIGRSDQENKDRTKHLARERRRLAREQREYIQSAFRDVCKEICVRTYQQALGILPGFEDPRCVCPPDKPAPSTAPKKSRSELPPEEHSDDCSCPECASTEPSTDNDEWVVEFTPPNVKFQPGDIPKKPAYTENFTQYSYLDYQVKLVDRYGNPVPRYFKGPDGNKECSDLGGFWGPNDKWLEMNHDGYIAPDGRWAPMTFKTPDGEIVDIADGKYQAANGEWLVVGVDGYVDEKGRWRNYGRARQPKAPPSGGGPGGVAKRGVGFSSGGGGGFRGGGGYRADNKNKGKSEASWSCFGDASPPDLAKLGVTGHGHDKKLLMTALKDFLSRDKNVRIPDKQHVPRAPPGAKTFDSRTYFEERYRCHHPEPSEKGVVAVDDQGNKTYFKMNYGKNTRPRQRVDALKERGISVSSFHAPCFRSFINSEIMKQQLRERRFKMAGIDMWTQK